LNADEINSTETQQIIVNMLETLRLAPGVGLAAPQVGLNLQLAIVEDREQYQATWSTQQLLARQRVSVPFHVLINPVIEIDPGSQLNTFFEGCLSVNGYTAAVPRSNCVHVRYLDEHGMPQSIEAVGWYARILQHEIDHLNGTLYIDRMMSRTFMSLKNYQDRWRHSEEEAYRVFMPAEQK